MKNRIVFILAILGLVAGLAAAYIFGAQPKSQSPAFAPATNPYDEEFTPTGSSSFQSEGANINIYPDVSGRIIRSMSSEGAVVRAGTQLIAIDDTCSERLSSR